MTSAYQNLLATFGVNTTGKSSSSASLSSKSLKKKTKLKEKSNEEEVEPSNEEISQETVAVDEDNTIFTEEDKLSKNDPFVIHFTDEPETAKTEDKQKEKETVSFELGQFKISSSVPSISCEEHVTDSLNLSLEDGNNRKIKKRIVDAVIKSKSSCTLSEIQSLLLKPMESYADILGCLQTLKNTKEIREVYCIHTLNHIYKTRDLIMKNNEIIKNNPDKEIRDQGFTRPKILILAPFKSSALEIVKILLKYSGTVEHANKKRFLEEYCGEDGDVTDENEGNDSQEGKSDYDLLFDGNNDDCFRIGLKFSRKITKIYSDFYSSDIIIASPLGLRILIGSEGDAKRDFDFLSSIEICVVDQSNVINMQNFEHIHHILSHMNRIPKESHDTDFSRIKSFYLDGLAKNKRQTILLSEYNFPELNAIFNRTLTNVTSGKFKITFKYSDRLSQIHLPVTQTFQRLQLTSHSMADDERFEYFKDKLLPSLVNSLNPSQICIFVPSYLDFVRVRNLMLEKEISFTFISEYSSDKEITKARSQFYNKHVNILVITERFHFFKRLRIRGIQQLVFYSLPENVTSFYPELISFLQDDKSQATFEMSVLTLFSKFDAMKLERLMGAKKAAKLISHDKNVFVITNK